MIMHSKINGLKFFTITGVEVTEHILEGKTKVFKELNKAKAFAEEKSSYTYPINFMNKTKKIKFYGYAAPN